MIKYRIDPLLCFDGTTQSISSSRSLIPGKSARNVRVVPYFLPSSNLSIRSRPSADDPPVFLHSSYSPLLPPTSFPGGSCNNRRNRFPSFPPLHLVLVSSTSMLVLNAGRVGHLSVVDCHTRQQQLILPRKDKRYEYSMSKVPD